MSSIYHNLSPIEILPTDCIGASLVTINNNYNTLYDYCTSLNTHTLSATHNSFGVVKLSYPFTVADDGGISLKIDKSLLTIGSEGELKPLFTINSNITGNYVHGDGITFVGTSDTNNNIFTGTLKAHLTKNGGLEFDSNGGIQINSSEVSNLIQETLPIATNNQRGIVQIGDGLTVTTNGIASLLIDTDKLSIDDNKRLTVLPQATQVSRGIKEFKAKYGTLQTSYTWTVPEGIFNIKIFAASAGGSKNTTISDGGDTVISLKDNLPFITLRGGGYNKPGIIESNISNTIGTFLNGVKVSESTLQGNGVTIFNNLKVSNTKDDTYGNLTFNTLYNFPGGVSDTDCGTGSAAIFYLDVIPGSILHIYVGSSVGDAYPGFVLVEY